MIVDYGPVDINHIRGPLKNNAPFCMNFHHWVCQLEPDLYKKYGDLSCMCKDIYGT